MDTAVRRINALAAGEASLDAQRLFAKLYADHFAFAWRTLRRLGVRESQLEDAAQDTFVVLHRRLSDLRPDASPKAFVFRVAQRVAHDYRRSARRKGAQSLDTESEISAEQGPFEHAAKAQGLRALMRFLESLDDDRRAVFMLTELEQMSAPEIAEALGANLSTTYSRLRSARELFVAFLAQEGASRG